VRVPERLAAERRAKGGKGGGWGEGGPFLRTLSGVKWGAGGVLPQPAVLTLDVGLRPQCQRGYTVGRTVKAQASRRVRGSRVEG